MHHWWAITVKTYSQLIYYNKQVAFFSLTGAIAALVSSQALEQVMLPLFIFEWKVAE